jgi:hypothetical protein
LTWARNECQETGEKSEKDQHARARIFVPEKVMLLYFSVFAFATGLKENHFALPSDLKTTISFVQTIT